jgi:hypothetical protein
MQSQSDHLEDLTEDWHEGRYPAEMTLEQVIRDDTGWNEWQYQNWVRTGNPEDNSIPWLVQGGITLLSRLQNGAVLCCLCFEYKRREELNPTEDGKVEDVCLDCARIERRV